MGQGKHQPGAGGAQGMADGQCPAIHVQLFHGDAQFIGAGYDLGGERFVELNAVDLVHGQSGVFHGLFGGRHRAQTHHLGLHSGDSEPDYPGQGFQAQRQGLLFAHDQDGADAVIGGGRVSGGDDDLAAAVADYPRDGVQVHQGLEVGPGPDALVLVEGDGLAPFVGQPFALVVEHRLFHFQGHDLIPEPSLCIGIDGLLVAGHGVFIQVGAGQPIDFGHVLGRLQHGHLGGRV